MKKRLKYLFLWLPVIFSLASCMKYAPNDEEEFNWGKGVFITNEGNFLYGNASLSYYRPHQQEVENEVFVRANSMKLGDVAQSMTLHNGKGYIAVNYSGVVFEIDPETARVTNQYTGFTSPRYIHFINDTKAYVTDLYASAISILNPVTGEITGQIPTPGHRSTEQMAAYGKYLFVACWSGDQTVLVIDTGSDTIVDSIEVGRQPNSLVIDRNNKVWALCGGDTEAGIASALCRIDGETRIVEKTFAFGKDDFPVKLTLNVSKDTLYFINKSVWRMDVTDERLPIRPFFEEKGTIFYGLGVDPETSEVYVADAIDYQQPGIVYRLTSSGEMIDSFRVGIIPGSFCFY